MEKLDLGGAFSKPPPHPPNRSGVGAPGKKMTPAKETLAFPRVPGPLGARD